MKNRFSHRVSLSLGLIYGSLSLVFGIISILVGPGLSQEGIFENPQDILGYDGQRVSFLCTVDSSYQIFWYWNNKSPPSEPIPPYRGVEKYLPQPSNPTGVTSILTIDASSLTNNTEIICEAFDSATLGSHYSPPAYIAVQGAPSAPQVHYKTDSTSVNMSLTKPYCLPGAQIAHYGCLAQFSEQNLTIMTNFTDPEFNFVFSEFNITRCLDQYINFSLCAYNAAGEGDFTHINVFLPKRDEYCHNTATAPTTLSSFYYIIITLAGVLIVILTMLILLYLVIGLARKNKKKTHVSPDHKMNTIQNVAYAGVGLPMTKNEAYASVNKSAQEPVYEEVGQSRNTEGKSYNHEYQDA